MSGKISPNDLKRAAIRFTNWPMTLDYVAQRRTSRLNPRSSSLNVEITIYPKNEQCFKWNFKLIFDRSAMLTSEMVLSSIFWVASLAAENRHVYGMATQVRYRAKGTTRSKSNEYQIVSERLIRSHNTDHQMMLLASDSVAQRLNRQMLKLRPVAMGLAENQLNAAFQSGRLNGIIAEPYGSPHTPMSWTELTLAAGLRDGVSSQAGSAAANLQRLIAEVKEPEQWIKSRTKTGRRQNWVEHKKLYTRKGEWITEEVRRQRVQYRVVQITQTLHIELTANHYSCKIIPTQKSWTEWWGHDGITPG